MMAETKKTTLAEDFIKLLAAIPVMPKDSINPFFKSKYTSLDTIKETTTPIMVRHNFSWTTLPSYNEQGEPTLKYKLMHVSGECIEGEMKLLLKTQDPQGQGSAITYARRYAISAVLDIVSDIDDDGTAAQKAVQEAKKPLVDEPSPEYASVDMAEEDRKIIMTQISENAKAKGAKSKQDILRVANSIGATEDFTKLSIDKLKELKSRIATTPKSLVENLLIEEPFK